MHISQEGGLVEEVGFLSHLATQTLCHLIFTFGIVRNVVYSVTINDLKHLKYWIRNATESVRCCNS